MKEFLKINPADNVVVAIQPLSKGTVLDVDGEKIELITDVPAGHKCALKDFAEGENIIKYGFPIGHARHAVKKGSYMDHEDIKTNLAGTLDYSDIKLKGLTQQQPSGEQLTFEGYQRADGQVGIRNEVWVIPTVGCVNGVCYKIANKYNEMRNKSANPEDLPEAITYGHNYGCSQLSEDHENTKKILRDMVHHPNAGGILVVGLGCENNQPRIFEEFCGDYNKDRVKFMICQEVQGDEVPYGVSVLKELVKKAQQDKRETVPASKLRIGLKCGGSDAFSGITANPTVGRVSDRVVSCGGATILTEVPEMFGAEQILMNKCESKEVYDKYVKMILDFKKYYTDLGFPVYENPSPGNKEGGIHRAGAEEYFHADNQRYTIAEERVFPLSQEAISGGRSGARVVKTFSL